MSILQWKGSEGAGPTTGCIGMGPRLHLRHRERRNPLESTIPHHGYQHAAEARERALMAEAVGWEQIGRGGDVRLLYCFIHNVLPSETICPRAALGRIPQPRWLHP